eukprot:42896-Chlamydomonas_euryale.AAC.1
MPAPPPPPHSRHRTGGRTVPHHTSTQPGKGGEGYRPYRATRAPLTLTRLGYCLTRLSSSVRSRMSSSVMLPKTTLTDVVSLGFLTIALSTCRERQGRGRRAAVAGRAWLCF